MSTGTILVIVEVRNIFGFFVTNFLPVQPGRGFAPHQRARAMLLTRTSELEAFAAKYNRPGDYTL